MQTKEKLLDLLHKIYPESSKRTLKGWIENGRVSVNNQVVKKPHFVCSENSTISLLKKNLCPIPVVYKDAYLIVIDKPSGLLSVPKEHSMQQNALDILRKHFKDENIYQVHRLDQMTSGLLVFARGKGAAKELCKAFKNHDVLRDYYAVCEGKIMKDEGKIESYVRELNHFTMASSQNPDLGKKAITFYKVHKRKSFSTHVHLSLKTGKKHQIRLHMQDMGHPVLGDKKYGCFYDPIKRLVLHAYRLELEHPILKKKMIFDSSIPPRFTKI